MTEQEWNSCDDPQRMLRYARGLVRGVTYDNPTIEDGVRVVSDRKLRLIACACCRLGWELLTEHGRAAVAALEGYADGVVSENAMEAACYSVRCRLPGRHPLMFPGMLGNGGGGLRQTFADSFANFLTLSVNHSGCAAILRDIIGTPHRPVTLPDVLPQHLCQSCQSPMVMEASHQHGLGLWHCTKDRRHTTRAVTIDEMRIHKKGGCPWLTADVVALAHAAYDERERKCNYCRGVGAVMSVASRSFGRSLDCPECHGVGRTDDGTLDPVRLSILADALEEAGCSVGCVHEYNDGGTVFWYNDTFGKAWPHLTPDRAAEHPIIAHLRSPGPHYRGCHVVDLILGKQ